MSATRGPAGPLSSSTTTSHDRRTAAAARPARVVALGSARGGVGRSTLCVELARALARHDQTVLLVEVDPRGQPLATLLDLPAPAVVERSTAPTAFRTAPGETNISGVSLVGLCDGPDLAHRLDDPLRTLDQVRELMLRLHQSSFDWVILDLPAGLARGGLALFVAADVPLMVSTSEPSALVGSASFLRGCLLASVAQQQDAELTRQVEALAARAPQRWTFADLHNELDAMRAAALEEACERLGVGLLLNQVREASEHEQALALCHAWALTLGVWPRFQGGIVYDDRRWFFARRLAPANHHPRDESLAGDADRLARSLLELDWQAWGAPSTCLPTVDPSLEPQVFLDVANEPGANIRQRYRRLWEGYRRDPGLVSCVVDAPARARALSLLETAYRRITLDEEAADAAAAAGPGAAEVTRSSPSLRQHPGQRIRLARMRQGLGLRELSLRTRVGVKHINAIEACIVRELPSRVYLKAYLAEIATTLGLDPQRLAADYLAHIEGEATGED